jgi:hypothetical protein
MNESIRKGAAVVGIVVVSAVTGAVVARAAGGTVVCSSNPCQFTRTDGTQDGVVLQGDTGNDPNLIIAKDHNGAPIWAVDQVSGPDSFGAWDRFFPPGDVFHPSIVVSPYDPSLPCTDREMWIGGGWSISGQATGNEGHIWRCSSNAWRVVT